MIDTNIRKYVQKSVDRVAVTTRLTKLHPNHITIGGFVVGVISAVAVAISQPIVALGLLWFSGLLDVLDGTVARLTSRSSKLGAFLDLVFDRLVEGAMIIGFFFFLPEHALSYLIFFLSVIFNFSTFMLAGNLFKNEGKKGMHYDIGLVERTETFITFSFMLLFPSMLPIFLNVFNALVIITGCLRMHRIVIYTGKVDKK